MAEARAGARVGMDGRECVHPGADTQDRADLPHSQAAAREMLMLPLFPDLTFEQQDYVIARLSEHLRLQAAA